MWQGLVKNWLLNQARAQVQAAAMQAATESASQARPADEQGPPRHEPEVCHIGLVFAMPIEAGGLVDRLSGVIKTEGAGFAAREGGLGGKRLVLIESGIGREAAARATQALIAGHQPRWIISAGFAGGLHTDLARGDILLANQIVDLGGRQLDIDFKLDRETIAAQRGLHVGRLLTVDRIIADPAEKESLGQRHDAVAVDMESIAVAQVCRDAQVRFLPVRVISDPVGSALPTDIDYLIKRHSTAGKLGAAFGAIVRRPASIKDMWQLKEDALVASERLAGFLTGIIAQLP
jgi:adenosylhomocysteine nucleosidase